MRIKSETIEQRVENWVREMAQRGDEVRLPSLRELSVRFSISVPRLSGIFHRLRDEGVVDIAKKRGISTRKRFEIPPVAGTTSAVDRIYYRIKTRIVQGIYPFGSDLPKLSQIANELSAGQATVLRAYRGLVQEGIVSRVGRGYRVGRPRDDAIGNQGCVDRYIIIVQCRPRAFPNLLKNNWTRDFASSFLKEMSQNGIQPLPVLVSSEPGPEQGSGMPRSRDGIAETLHELGENCLGMLVIGIAWDYKNIAHESFDEFLGWLCSFGKPVVWFDQMDAGGYYQNEHGVRESLRRALRKKTVRQRFVRCRFDERKAVELALSVIRNRGHERVGVIALSSPSPETWSWVHQRCCCLKDAAKREVGTIDLRIITPDCDDLSNLDELLNSVFGAGVPIPTEVERFMGRNTALRDLPYPVRNLVELSSVRKSIQDSSFDCFIAPNDQMARLIRGWGYSTGVSAARSKPLLSFDDRLEILYPYRVSSVNFGFDILGTAAFRVFSQGNPAHSIHPSTISAIPRMNHLHSL